MSVKFRVFGSGKLNVPYNLAAGQAAQEPQVLYPVPTGKSAVIHSMRFVRNDSPTPPGSIYRFLVAVRHNGGPPAIIFPERGEILLTWISPLAVEDRDLPLGDGDELVAWVGKDGDPANSAYVNTIDYLICGIERDS